MSWVKGQKEAIIKERELFYQMIKEGKVKEYLEKISQDTKDRLKKAKKLYIALTAEEVGGYTQKGALLYIFKECDIPPDYFDDYLSRNLKGYKKVKTTKRRRNRVKKLKSLI